jgi:hypothetical protein
MPEIPKPSEVQTNELGAPVTSVLVPATDTEPEAIPYSLSFARYNKGECQIDGMSKDNAQATLKVLRDVGVYFIDDDSFKKSRTDTEVKFIVDSGEYSGLFKGCRDEEIREIKLVKPDKSIDIRLFFFTVGRMFYVIAVRATHYDTTKGGQVKKPFKHKFSGKRKGWR